MAAVLFGVSGASAVVWLTEKGGDGSPARRAVEPTPDASAAAAQGPAATPDASAPDAGRGPQADAGTRGKSRQKVDSGAKVAEPSPVRQPEPRDLLRRANRLRKAQRWRAAERAYGAVAGRHPGSRSAHVARVAAASLRLEKLGDPRGALELYRAVLRRRPEGNLAAEARYGVAEALRALGDRSGEARALEQFLEAHPDNALAGAARQRLRELR
jgi:TolA-binding protein